VSAGGDKGASLFPVPEEKQVRMDQRVRRGILKTKRVPSQSTSVVQATTGYSTLPVLRGYRKGD